MEPVDAYKIILSGQLVYVKDIDKNVTVEGIRYNKETNEIVIKVINYPWEPTIGKKTAQDLYENRTVYPWDTPEDNDDNIATYNIYKS